MQTAHVLPATGDRPAEPCPDLLTEDEAAGYLRLNCEDVYSSLRRYRRRGLDSAKVGRQILYRREALIEFIQRIEIGKDKKLRRR